MVAPLILKIVAFSVAKKVVVFLVAKLYGFPRIYRRASQINHYINRDNPKRREKFQDRLQFLFRLPSHIYETVQRWRGVQPFPGSPSSATGHPHGTTSSNSQHKQVRDIHTRSGALRVVSSLNFPNPRSSLSGFGSFSQSIRSHLLGFRGESGTSRIRPFSDACALPFGVSSLISPKISAHTGPLDSYVAQIESSLQDSQSGYLPNSGLSVQICPAQEASIESSLRSVSETKVSAIDESRCPSPKSVGLSLVL